MKTSTNFWGTLEVYCACAGMDYEKDYLEFMKKEVHAPLCKEAYQKLGELVDIQMEKDFDGQATEEQDLDVFGDPS